ncbi:MAG: D-beta-D-heptose 1-phosphate adenylyltransferase [Pseudomonadota bacterium]|jgi:D-beta-D-heptose 7-phosphate kinase/D-beta-D-heptose 1-phosphate adenosyltransferase
MLDRYVRGEAERISPEAPVPVVRVNREDEVIGGAGNVANNLVALGAQVEFFSVVGPDEAAGTLRALLQARGIPDPTLLVDGSRPTTTKTRVASGGHQIVRFDLESTAPLQPGMEDDLLQAVLPAIERASAMVVSDYLKGVVGANLVQRIVERCRARGIPVLCDPKGRDFRKYRGATLLTPNRREAQVATGVQLDTDAGVERAAKQLQEAGELDAVLITLGAGGMALYSDRVLHRIPTRAREVFDVSGAGDTVLAALAFALAGGQSLRAASEFANAAAGVVVGKLGTATVTLEEIASLSPQWSGAVGASKLRSRADLLVDLARVRARGGKVVFTNGCFDILHAGHVRYLQQAAALGDVLVVGLNDDMSVSRLKGPTRPVNRQDDRATVLSALSSVSYVTLFEEDTPHELIRAVAPDLLVKGGDYRADEVVGGDLLRERGGQVVILDLVAGLSTTAILQKSRGD